MSGEQLGEAAELLPVGDIRERTDITLDIGAKVRFEKITDEFEPDFLSFGKKPAPKLFGKRPVGIDSALERGNEFGCVLDFVDYQRRRSLPRGGFAVVALRVCNDVGSEHALGNLRRAFFASPYARFARLSPRIAL